MSFRSMRFLAISINKISNKFFTTTNKSLQKNMLKKIKIKNKNLNYKKLIKLIQNHKSRNIKYTSQKYLKKIYN